MRARAGSCDEVPPKAEHDQQEWKGTRFILCINHKYQEQDSDHDYCYR